MKLASAINERQVPADRLREISSATIANALDLMQVRPRGAGYADASLRLLTAAPTPVVGYAVTACASTDPAHAPGQKRIGTDALIEAFLNAPCPRILVLQDLATPPRGALFGEVLGTTIRTFGYVGLITNGAIRDLDALSSLGLPCWATGVTAGFTGGGYLTLGEPVTIAGLTVNTGDLLHADSSGVVHIPAPTAEPVVELAHTVDEIEQRFVQALRAAGEDLAAMKRAMQTLRDEMGQLRGRAARHAVGASA